MGHNLLPYFVCREFALLRMAESLMFDSPYLKTPHPRQKKKRLNFKSNWDFSNIYKLKKKGREPIPLPSTVMPSEL